MTFKSILICVLFAFSYAANAESTSNINFSINFKAAEGILDAMENGISDENLETLVQLEPVLGLIRQTRRFDENATEENFKLTLRQIANGDDLSLDPFRFMRVKNNIEDIKVNMALIEANPDMFSEALEQAIAPYTSTEDQFDVTIFMVVGGTSDGWAPSRNFYIALHYFGDDIEGLKLMMSHELYHGVQNRFFGSPDIEGFAQSQNLLSMTKKEGVASMIGDPLRLENGKTYTDTFKEKFENNLNQIKQNFALFEVMLFRLYGEPDYRFENIYSLGFSGNWGSPLYFVGYYMGRALEEKHGQKGFLAILKESPAGFFRAYMELYKSDDTLELVHFSEEIEAILSAL